MVFLGAEAQLDARFSPFWMHPMKLLGDVGHVESCFGRFGDIVSLGVR
jgi:hypothetical protein